MRATSATQRRQLTAVPALLITTAITLTGCGTPAAGHHSEPTPPSPINICTSLISYWAEQTLTHGKWAGLDWAQKGLSSAQFRIHEDIVRAADIEQQRHGTDAARKLIHRQARQRCAAADGATCCAEHAPTPSTPPATRAP